MRVAILLEGATPAEARVRLTCAHRQLPRSARVVAVVGEVGGSQESRLQHLSRLRSRQALGEFDLLITSTDAACDAGPTEAKRLVSSLVVSDRPVDGNEIYAS